MKAITYKNISLVAGDLTKSPANAIVNAANSIMLGGGGVDGAIHRAAGPRLLEECRKVKSINGERCPVGQARITQAGDLPCDFVIHTVGPRYRQVTNAEVLLISAYRASLNLAIENNLKSISFPAISCGSYGYPLGEAARIALFECMKKEYDHLDISFYLYPKNVFLQWCDSLDLLKAGCESNE